MMETELLTLIEGDAGVQAAAGRAQFAAWGHAPALDVLPRIVLHHVSEVPDQLQAGPGKAIRSRVQADVWADSYAGAVALARALRVALDGYGDGSIERIVVELTSDEIETSAEPVIYGRRMDFMVHWKEQ